MGGALNDGASWSAWCVLQTAPRRGPYVCNQLTTHGVEHYAPQFPRGSRTRPGSVRDQRRRWVFPGYVFFRPPQSVDTWHLIRWAPGVRRILEQDGGPATISDAVIRHLNKRIAEMSTRFSGPQFKPGQPVVIERGPLAAVDAIFDKELNTPARVQILVQLMGRELPVHINVEDLRSVG